MKVIIDLKIKQLYLLWDVSAQLGRSWWQKEQTGGGKSSEKLLAGAVGCFPLRAGDISGAGWVLGSLSWSQQGSCWGSPG